MQRRALLTSMAASLIGFGGLTQAQQAPVASPVLTIDSERLFLESDFGRRVAADIETQGRLLTVENRQIETDLEAEERALTDQRADMTPEDFRALADTFDEKVQRTRQAQTTKGRALNLLLEEEREVFLNAAAPILEQLMREAGAAVILERRSVFVSAASIEITDDAIALLNETLGSGVE